MKKIAVPMIIFLACMSCQEENETIYALDPDLQPYVETFYNEAAERNITIPQNLVAEFGIVQGISLSEKINQQNYLRVDPHVFPGLDERQKEAHVYYRLAQVFLYIDIEQGETFANPDFMFTPYNPVNKEAMFDNLFSR